MKSTATRIVLALLLATFVVSAIGCGTKLAPPKGVPSIIGAITSITPGQGGFGAVLVEETSPKHLAFDKASLAITADTLLMKRVGDTYERIGFGDLKRGMLVEVWITGPVRESYPVQADADTLVVLE